MQTVTLRAKADSDGRLTIDVTEAIPDAEYEIVVVMHTEPTANGNHAEDDVPPLGTVARLVYEAQKSDIQLERDIDLDEMKRILTEDFAEHLTRWERENDDE